MFIQHYATCVAQLRHALQEEAATFTAAERATAFAIGCQHLAVPIRRDIERLQWDEPDRMPDGQRWTERVAAPALE